MKKAQIKNTNILDIYSNPTIYPYGIENEEIRKYRHLRLNRFYALLIRETKKGYSLLGINIPKDWVEELRGGDPPYLKLKSYELVLRDCSKIKKQIKKLLEQLGVHERTVIKRFYGLSEECVPREFKEIGEEFHLTRERIRQIWDKGMRKLKHSLILFHHVST